MVKEEHFLGALLGDWHTDHLLIGVMNERAKAEQAAEELRQAGWNDEDFQLVGGKEAVKDAEQKPENPAKQQSLPRRVVNTIRDVTSNEGGLAQEYMEEARHGHQILAIYTPDAEHEERARQILHQYEAHHVECFGTWSITDVRREEDLEQEASHY